ncbi:MAG: amidohydrolase family protein [Lentisphaerae bacterium]|nr:amidohydrolase family protein [Lentisphaerota bacterium]
MKVIDFHTHAFPDDLAPRAMASVGAKSDVPAALDGTVSALLRSMDSAGVERSVICSIATKPTQFRGILDWSRKVRSERLIMFPSIHPAAPDALSQIKAVHAEGFLGVKLHPYYQDFDLDEPRLEPIYDCLQEYGLMAFCHTGFDVAFPRVRRADPARIWKVATKFPGLKFIATHLGAWEDWQEAERLLIGKNIRLEMSFSIPYLGAAETRRLLLAHPADYLLFGTDSPWADQAEDIRRVQALNLPLEREQKLFYDNARGLLGS